MTLCQYQPEVWWTLAFSSAFLSMLSMLLPILSLRHNVLEINFEPNCHRLASQVR